LRLLKSFSALTTEEYLGERAKRGDKRKFLRAMAKVSNAKPAEHDKL
jgi:hypothetical protein